MRGPGKQDRRDRNHRYDTCRRRRRRRHGHRPDPNPGPANLEDADVASFDALADEK